MLRLGLAFVAVVVLAVCAGFALIVVAMRTKSPRLLGAVRRFNRGFTNKLQRRSAGRPGTTTSLLRHRGRTSGRTYETPVVPFATDGGLLISLPYGSDTDWLKNVLASGSAVLVTDGRTCTVDRPEVLATDAAKDEFPLKVFGDRGQEVLGQVLTGPPQGEEVVRTPVEPSSARTLPVRGERPVEESPSRPSTRCARSRRLRGPSSGRRSSSSYAPSASVSSCAAKR